MKSIRAKILSLILFTVITTALAILLVAIVCINYLNRKDSNQLLTEIGQKNASEINGTLESMEHSVDSIYNFAYGQLSANPKVLESGNATRIYLNRFQELMISEAGNTESVLAAYFRLSTDYDEMDDPGFLFVADEKTGRLTKIELTDISLYDPDDVEHVGWYYVPQEVGEATWVGPYMNRNLGSGMISYVAPIYINQAFTAVVGMDIDIHVLRDRVKKITAYETGTALLFGGDEFAAKQSKEDEATFGVSYQIAAGAATYQKGEDQSFNEVFHRADQLMYENKRMLKGTDDE